MVIPESEYEKCGRPLLAGYVFIEFDQTHIHKKAGNSTQAII
jgi:hypothetical protein